MLAAWSDPRSLDTEVFVQKLDGSGVPQLAANGGGAYTTAGVQGGASVIVAGDGGVLVFWSEKKNGEYDIRGRKFAADGSPVGGTTMICGAPGHQSLEAVIDDGAGGAILAWTDRRNGNEDVYAQRVNSNAVPQWAANGVAACTAGGSRRRPRIASDGAGGVIMTWQDAVTSTDPNILAQRINSSGTPQWGASGAAVCTDPSLQFSPVLASDGAGGAIVFWNDLRSQIQPGIYAQRVNGSGAPQWTANGVRVLDSGATTLLSGAVPTLSNGAIVLVNQIYDDYLNNRVQSYLLTQEVSDAGVVTVPGGALITDGSNLCLFERIVDDGDGGAFVAWSDARNGAFDVYAQHVSGGGIQWFSNPLGVPVCGATGWQYLGGLTHRSDGSSFYIWSDQRSGQLDIYAQALNFIGAPLWTADGVQVCAASHGQFGAAIAPWKPGPPCRLYTAWTDNRAGNERYVFQQQLNCSGQAQWASDGLTSTLLSLIAAEANAHRVRLEWYSAQATSAAVYRSTPDEAWTRIGDASSDGGGHLNFVDTDVESGVRYGYRLVVMQGGVQTFSEVTWVDVPASLEPALEGLRPNPTAEEPVVAFTLGRGGDASLEIIDLAGRRVAHRDLLGLDPGLHVVRLGHLLPPGVYMISLIQAGERRTARAVVRP